MRFPSRYIPNISKALFTVLQKMEAKRLLANNNSSNSSSSGSGTTNDVQNVLAQLRLKTLTESTLSEHLHKAVDKYEADSLVQSTLERSHTDSGSGKRRKLFLMPSVRVFEYALPVQSTSSGNAGAIDLPTTPDKDDIDSPYSETMDAQDNDTTNTVSAKVSASGKKRYLSQLSRANTADTVNTFISTTSGSNNKHRWIPLTLQSATASGSSKSSVGEDNHTQLSQADATSAALASTSTGAVTAYILV